MTSEQTSDQRDTLLHAALTHDAQLADEDYYRQRYVINLEVTGPTATVPVRSAWIIRQFLKLVEEYNLTLEDNEP